MIGVGSVQRSRGGGVLIRPMVAVVLTLVLAAIAVPTVQAEEAVVLQVGQGKLLRINNIQRVLVAAPAIADVNVISRNELMVMAKALGQTTINVWTPAGISTYRVAVVIASVSDVGGAIKEALGESVQVKIVGDTVILAGTVRDDAAKARAEAIASAFGKRVINLLTVEQPTAPPRPATQVLDSQLREALKNFPVTIAVTGADTVRIEGVVATRYELQQVETIAKSYAKNVVLLVRVKEPVQIQIATIVAEINRTALNQLGVQYGGGDILGNLITPFGFAFGYITNGNIALQTLVARLTLLEQRNAARTLANPRLVVTEGQSSKMLVGGEIPIPTVTSLGQTNVTFQPFGVRLEFKPVYRPDEPISLDILTEVSSLDFANAVVSNGFTIPALKTRRVESNVSVRPGEFLAIGGLISRDDTRVINKIPILGDIPIIGALFRSTSFSRGETELVIFVTPTLVKPTTEQPQPPPVPNPDEFNP